MHAQFGEAFPLSAWEELFSLPQDVTTLTTTDLLQAGACDKSQWLVIAGWECQDLSTAGKGLGLEGMHSRTFFDVLQLVGTLQQLQSHRLPGYILENVAPQHNHSSPYIWDYKSTTTSRLPFVDSCLGFPSPSMLASLVATPIGCTAIGQT